MTAASLLPLAREAQRAVDASPLGGEWERWVRLARRRTAQWHDMPRDLLLLLARSPAEVRERFLDGVAELEARK